MGFHGCFEAPRRRPTSARAPHVGPLGLAFAFALGPQWSACQQEACTRNSQCGLDERCVDARCVSAAPADATTADSDHDGGTGDGTVETADKTTAEDPTDAAVETDSASLTGAVENPDADRKAMHEDAGPVQASTP